MAPRAYWKGYLRLSLVSCPIQLFPATSEREKIRSRQINKKTGNRIKYCKLDAKTGEEVEAENIVMGYEVSKGHKGHYVEITKDELEAIAIENTHTIEIDQFVLGNEIGDLYFEHSVLHHPRWRGRPASLHCDPRRDEERRGGRAWSRDIHDARACHRD
jgi:DNA end-binding protein Ku